MHADFSVRLVLTPLPLLSVQSQLWLAGHSHSST